MILGFGNNVVSSLASDITASQTTFSVIPGDGPLFASLLTSDFSNKSTTLKNYAKITLTDSGETAFEVCHLTAVSGDTLTVIRGQEGSTAKGWALKDVVANFATRGSENAFPQIAHIQSGFYTSGTAGGTANALTLELPTTFFLNGSANWVLKTPIVVYPSQNNTGAATLQLTMGGRVLGTFKLYKGNKAELVANDILKDVALVCLMDNTRTFFNVANPGAIYAGLGTAAFKDVVTSQTDTTAGRVLTVGYGGLGGAAPRTAVVPNTNYDNIPTGLKSGFWTHAVSGGPYAYTFTLFQDGGAQTQSRHFIIPSDPNGKIAFRWDGASGTNSKDYQYFYTDKNKPTATDVDAIPLTGSTGVTGIVRSSAELQSTSANSFRIGYGGYGTFWRNDGANLYLMLTNQNDPWGSYNALRPFLVTLNNGEVIISKLNLSDFGYFDARYYTKEQSDAGYMAKKSAYTKAESDARYGAGKTTTGSNSAYYTHGNGTVFMQSVRNISVGNNATVTVTLPTSFPNGILGIGSSYNGSGGNAQASYYLCTPVGKNQIKIQTHNCNGTFYLNVTGY